jgi:tetratricopeptide (TPR) repeat protein
VRSVPPKRPEEPGEKSKFSNSEVLEEQSWTAADLMRSFGIKAKQFEGWQEQGLFPVRDAYSFEDLVALRVLIKLRDMGVSAKRMKTAFASVKAQVGSVDNPWKEVRLSVEGKRVQVQTKGRKMEAESGQLVFNFDEAEMQKLLRFPSAKPDGKQQVQRARVEAETCFQRGLELEQNGADKREAIAAYEEALTHFPEMAGALVNIGTIYFNARRWKEAERYYGRALGADADYPLAHFNLANLHEELGRTSLAIQHYKKAIELLPTYADAHYNLALLYQTRERPMEALRHWKIYLQLDGSSHWASIARRELNRLKEAAVIRSRSGSESA